MQEPPRLDVGAVLHCLRAEFGISAQTAEFLPLGNDSSAWVFRVLDADGTHFFVKTRLGAVNPASLLVPRVLSDYGIGHMAPPLPARSGQLWQPLDEFELIVYPYLDAQMAAHTGLTDDQWREFGATLRNIHAAPVPDALAVHLRRETFTPLLAGVLRECDAYVMAGRATAGAQAELADLWMSHRDTILHILTRTEALSRAAQSGTHKFVICHADIHLWNVLVAPDGQFYVVDWDEVVYAPRERDLMFQTSALFLEGYGGHVTPDPITTAYYRFDWVVQEIADYGKRVFFGDFGEETLRFSIDHFTALFAPGNVVSAAYAADHA